MKVICWILRVVGGGPNGVGLCIWRAWNFLDFETEKLIDTLRTWAVKMLF